MRGGGAEGKERRGGERGGEGRRLAGRPNTPYQPSTCRPAANKPRQTASTLRATQRVHTHTHTALHTRSPACFPPLSPCAT